LLENAILRRLIVDDNSFDSWVAGFWEGEGSLHKQKNGYVVSISQSLDIDRDIKEIMKKLKRTYGGNISFVRTKGNYKNQLHWRISKGVDVINFIKRIYPYCQFRRFQLDNFLTYIKNNPQHFTKFVYVDFIEAKKLREKGLTYSKIGEIMNLPPVTVWRRINLYASVAENVIWSIV